MRKGFSEMTNSVNERLKENNYWHYCVGCKSVEFVCAARGLRKKSVNARKESRNNAITKQRS